jgi:NAD(P)-dependent dehydrogenase (short-subunit alcohol dehydrogenase family)
VTELKDKTILITGGAHRLGKAMTLAAAEAGAQVVFTYLQSAEEAEDVLAQIKAKDNEGLSLRCDVRDANSIAAAVDATVKRFGKIDVLINNAGRFETIKFENLTQAQWDDIFAVNVRGPFLVAQRCLAALRQSHGRIINIGSLGGEHPWATHAHYCSSKAALHMLTKVMAKALAPEIAVNCVAPGMIDLADGTGDASAFKRFAEKTPMQRNGTPADVVSAVLYFAAAPHFVTGQILSVDGGLGLE